MYVNSVFGNERPAFTFFYFIVGRKTGTNHRTVERVNSVSDFVSRLEADLSIATIKEIVDDMIGYQCKVKRLKTKHA